MGCRLWDVLAPHAVRRCLADNCVFRHLLGEPSTHVFLASLHCGCCEWHGNKQEASEECKLHPEMFYNSSLPALSASF